MDIGAKSEQWCNKYTQKNDYGRQNILHRMRTGDRLRIFWSLAKAFVSLMLDD